MTQHERSGWRDLRRPERHRRWGWDLPAEDLDFLELRKVAQTRIAAVEREARAKIEHMSADAQVELIANGLRDAAKALLRVDQLMPALALTEAEALLEDRRGR
jgi:hypothetical protein